MQYVVHTVYSIKDNDASYENLKNDDAHMFPIPVY